MFIQMRATLRLIAVVNILIRTMMEIQSLIIMELVHIAVVMYVAHGLKVMPCVHAVMVPVPMKSIRIL